MPAPKASLAVSGSNPVTSSRANLEAMVDGVAQALFDQIGAVSTGLTPAGNWSAAGGTFPSGAALGTYYVVSTAGTVNGQAFAIGDWLIPLKASPSTTTYAGNWFRADYSKVVPRKYKTVTELLASLEVARGAGSIWEAQGFRYEEVTTGQHVTTAGGVKLKVLPGADGEIAFAAFGPAMNETAGDRSLFQQAVLACQTGAADGVGRQYCRPLSLPAGTLLIDAETDIAPVGGLSGLRISGQGEATTFIKLSGATAALKCSDSQFITWENLSFQSAGVDVEQAAFRVFEDLTGATLRSWSFRNVTFDAFFKCFVVTGTGMCSEFNFEDVSFRQCYHLMDNANDQALNWNFWNCDWENEGLSTVKDKNLASIFKLSKGTFVNWVGGSIVLHGKIASFEPTTSGVFERVSHRLNFEGVRLELNDNAGYHAPLFDKSATYTFGSNFPAISITDFTILNKGTLPNTLTLFNFWDGCRFSLTDGEIEGGKVTGILSANTPTIPGFLDVDNVYGLDYEEDVTNRGQTHHQHNVTIRAGGQNLIQKPVVQTRLGDVSNPTVVQKQALKIRGNTGSLPQAGTTVNLPAFTLHNEILGISIFRFGPATSSLTVDLRNQDDTVSYGSFTISAGDTYAVGPIGKEIGFEIPTLTPLMLKFTGTPEVVKGVLLLEYI